MALKFQSFKSLVFLKFTIPVLKLCKRSCSTQWGTYLFFTVNSQKGESCLVETGYKKNNNNKKRERRKRLLTLFIINCEQLYKEAESHGPAEYLSETKAIWSQVGRSWWPRCPIQTAGVFALALQGMGKGLYGKEVLPEFLARFHGHISIVYGIFLNEQKEIRQVNRERNKMLQTSKFRTARNLGDVQQPPSLFYR